MYIAQLHSLVPCTGVPNQHGNLLLWAALLAFNVLLGELGGVDRSNDLLSIVKLSSFYLLRSFVALSLIWH